MIKVTSDYEAVLEIARRFVRQRYGECQPSQEWRDGMTYCATHGHLRHTTWFEMDREAGCPFYVDTVRLAEQAIHSALPIIKKAHALMIMHKAKHRKGMFRSGMIEAAKIVDPVEIRTE